MNKEMTGEQYLSFFSGQITALIHMRTALIAMQPNRTAVTELFKKLSSYPIEDTSSEYYINGIKKGVEELEALLRIAVFAEQCALQKPGKDN